MAKKSNREGRQCGKIFRAISCLQALCRRGARPTHPLFFPPFFLEACAEYGEGEGGAKNSSMPVALGCMRRLTPRKFKARIAVQHDSHFFNC